MKILLDTCTFLWLNGDPEQLPARVREACAADENDLYLSVVSAWEIAVKCAAGWLTLPQEPSVWLPGRRERNGIASLPLTEEAVLQVAKLPDLHRDPFDRMLVCQALMEGMPVATPDPLIRQYPVRVLW